MTLLAERWDVTREQYHADRDHVSSSALRLFLDSPQLFRLAQLGLVAEKVDSQALAIGQAVHSNWLEPETFNERWAYQEKFPSQSTTVGKEKKAAWLAEHGHKQVLSHDDGLVALGCVKALLANPWAEALRVAPGENEVPIRWECPETGVWCRALLDMLRPAKRLVVDLKTMAGRPTKVNIEKAINDWQLQVQAVHYLAGALTVLGGADWQFIWIFVGTTTPHVAVVHPLSEGTRDYGERQRLELLRQIKRCQEERDWLQPVGLPEWFLRRMS